MAWTPVSDVFEGGTEAVRALIGKRVRSTSSTSYFGYDGVAQVLTTPDAVRKGEEGFIANPWHTSVLIAMPAGSFPRLASLDQLMRSGKFRVLAVDWNEFARRFEIDTDQPAA